MDLIDLLFILLGLFCPWLMWQCVKRTISEVRRIKRCTDEVTAEIISWRLHSVDSDSPDEYVPTIRYSYHDKMYEGEFYGGRVTTAVYKREYKDQDATMIISIDPDNAASVSPKNRNRTALFQIALCALVLIMLLFFFLLFVFTTLDLLGII